MMQREQIRLLHMFGQLFEQGYSAWQAIQIMQQAAHKREKQALASIAQVLQNGQPLSKGFETVRYPPTVVLMIAQSQQHASLASACMHAAKWLERRRKMRQEWQKACLYPVLLVIIIASVVTLLTTMVIPRFQMMFQSFQLELPAVTSRLLYIIEIVTAYMLPGVIAVIFSGIMIAVLWKRPSIQQRIVHLLLNVPFFNRFVQVVISSRFSIELGYLLSAHIPLHESVQSMIRHCSSPSMHRMLTRVESRLLNGQRLGEAVRGEQLLTSEMQTIIMYAEQNGTLGQQLVRFGTMLENETIEEWVRTIKWVEPLLLLFIGGMIAFIFYALFAPIVELMELF